MTWTTVGGPLKFPFIQTTKKWICQNVYMQCCPEYVHFIYAKEAKWIHFWPFPIQKTLFTLQYISYQYCQWAQATLCGRDTHTHSNSATHTGVDYNSVSGFALTPLPTELSLESAKTFQTELLIRWNRGHLEPDHKDTQIHSHTNTSFLPSFSLINNIDTSIYQKLNFLSDNELEKKSHSLLLKHVHISQLVVSEIQAVKPYIFMPSPPAQTFIHQTDYRNPQQFPQRCCVVLEQIHTY